MDWDDFADGELVRLAKARSLPHPTNTAFNEEAWQEPLERLEPCGKFSNVTSAFNPAFSHSTLITRGGCFGDTKNWASMTHTGALCRWSASGPSAFGIRMPKAAFAHGAKGLSNF